MRYNAQFGKPEKYIGPGDYFASAEDVIISTLLGSCISVALFDRTAKVGGLNHFMLPFPKTRDEEGLFSQSSRYGINAMELLINEILKKGGLKKNLHAKVFGGSSVIDFRKEATYNIPKMNIEFIFGFLEAEHIAVDSYSVGGSLPRKIVFFPVESRVLMRFSRTESSGLAHREDVYSQRLRESDAGGSGGPILF